MSLRLLTVNLGDAFMPHFGHNIHLKVNVRKWFANLYKTSFSTFLKSVSFFKRIDLAANTNPLEVILLDKTEYFN